MTQNGMGKVIFTYGIDQATKDGVLFDLRQILKPELREKSLLSHATTNLMHSRGYFSEMNDETKANVPNCLDLLNQALQIIKKGSENFTRFERFFSGQIETPNGEKLTVWIEFNELERFTVMLPEDH